MRRAILLARRGWGRTAPNPMVGAVVVRERRIVGEGWHDEFGGAHAEVVALERAGERARGADLFVTLEPCAHHGKTPPCVDALIRAGVRRVVIAARDPNPLAGGGADRLHAAGIEVLVGMQEEAARELNAPFFFAFSGAPRPFVTLKLALSADGAIAPAGGAQQWLTGARARREVQRLRSGADAIVVGIGTVLADDPRLTVRSGVRPRVPPVRVVLDRQGRLPIGSKLVRTAGKVPVRILAGAGGVPEASRRALERKGVRLTEAASLGAHLAVLKEEGVRHLLVEGGAGVAEALLEGGSVDRLIIFRSPVLLGGGALRPFGAASSPLDGPAPWREVERRSLGADSMTVYAPPLHR